MDSTGLETLTALQRECEEQLGLLKLANVGETIKKILDLTRLNRRFECFPSLTEALKAIG